MLGGVLMVVGLTVFIIVHEAGHFFTARATGMKATEFFVGFGPRIWSFRRGETEFGLKAIPLGGYVRIAGMDYRQEVDPADLGRTYREQVFWRKTVVVLSGVTLNLIMAFLLLFVAFLILGSSQFTTTLSRVGALPDGEPSPAMEIGLQPGDALTAIDGMPVGNWAEVATVISARPGSTVDLNFVRDNTPLTRTVTLASYTTPGGDTVGFLGISPQVQRGSISPLRAAGRAAQMEWEVGVGTLRAVGAILHPQSLLELFGVLVGDQDVPDDLRVVSPIGLVQIGAQVERSGVVNLLALMAVVNVTLAIFNSIPLYPLDGGHFAVAVYERLTGRTADTRKLLPMAAAVVGFVLFLGLVAVILDIMNPLTL